MVCIYCFVFLCCNHLVCTLHVRKQSHTHKRQKNVRSLKLTSLAQHYTVINIPWVVWRATRICKAKVPHFPCEIIHTVRMKHAETWHKPLTYQCFSSSSKIMQSKSKYFLASRNYHLTRLFFLLIRLKTTHLAYISKSSIF